MSKALEAVAKWIERQKELQKAVLADRYIEPEEDEYETEVEKHNRIMDTPSAWE